MREPRAFFSLHQKKPVKIFAESVRKPYICSTQSANLSERFHIMAKARVSTNPMYTGGAGGYSFYVRGGEQVVRQRRNNSNYGETASRSEAQMIRRVRWANLVNMYKACKFWMPKAFETKSKGQTDYNLFMSMNINEASVALTKDMAQNGCAVNAGQYVSRGSIAPIALYEYDTGVGAELEINMTITPGASTTVGQFASDIIANNPVFKEGDNLAIIMFTNVQDGRNYPYLQTTYTEVTLNSSSTQLLQSINLMNRISKSNGGRLKFAVGASQSHESGIAFIHTHKVGGELQVSTQRVFQTGENINEEYSGDIWTQECIDSYGLDVEVPLDPGAGGGGDQPGRTSFSTVLHGDDAERVVSDSYRMVPGSYVASASPALWDLDNLSDADIVFAIWSLTEPTAQPAAIVSLAKSQVVNAGGVSNVPVVIPDNAPYVRVVFRGDVGSTVVFSVR